MNTNKFGTLPSPFFSMNQIHIFQFILQFIYVSIVDLWKSTGISSSLTHSRVGFTVTVLLSGILQLSPLHPHGYRHAFQTFYPNGCPPHHTTLSISSLLHVSLLPLTAFTFFASMLIVCLLCYNNIGIIIPRAKYSNWKFSYSRVETYYCIVLVAYSLNMNIPLKYKKKLKNL